MPRYTSPLVALFVAFIASIATAEDKPRQPAAYPPMLDGATVEVYKTIGDVRLNIYEFFPAEHTAAAGVADRPSSLNSSVGISLRAVWWQ
jgi:hypothetical protein